MNRFRPNIFKNLIMILMVLFVIVGLNLFIEKYLEKNNENFTKIEIGGNFILTQSNNKEFKSKELIKKKLIYFGYTFCPDVCPIDLVELSSIYSQHTELINYIQPIFISVDPNRDTPQVISNFLENFDSSIIGLTGNEEQINKIKKKFKIYVSANLDESEEDFYTINHTSIFYLVDENDKYLKHFSRKNFSDEFTSYLINQGII